MNDLEKLDKIWVLLDDLDDLNDEYIKQEKNRLFSYLNSFAKEYENIIKIKENKKLEKWRKTFA